MLGRPPFFYNILCYKGPGDSKHIGWTIEKQENFNGNLQKNIECMLFTNGK